VSATEAIRALAARRLESGTAAVVIGHEAGSRDARRPLFARTAADVSRLVHDERCWHNLAVYAAKPEVRALGRMSIVATPSVLRALRRLVAEHQLHDGEVEALAVNGEGVRELSTLADIDAHLATMPDGLPAGDRAEIERLTALTPAERRAFWAEQLARCTRCYACRASCPMCYCPRCTMECNRPQWVPVASHGLGNLEYHVVRAMHLAGRCTSCGSCGRACPAGIPVHLLTEFAEDAVRRHFGETLAPGTYALSSFRPEDREDFIR
jgi:ferredoxin